MRKMNNKAQWQLIEVILVAGMLFAAMYLVRSSNITVYKSIEEENPLTKKAQKALDSIVAQPPPDIHPNNHNLLSYYIKDYVENGQKNDLINDIKTYFPPEANINFNLTLINITKIKEKGRTIEESTEVIYHPGFWIEENSCSARRIVVVDRPDEPNKDESTYEIVLSIWYNI